MDKKAGASRVFEHLLAGVAGGVASTLVLHPLDLVKIRFQVNEGVALAGLPSPKRPAYSGMIDAFASIYRRNGFLGLYQGVTPNIWGAGLSWGFYFFFYNGVKSWMQDGDSKVELSAGLHLTAAGTAGLATLVLTNPIWVVKTRLCLQYDQPPSQVKTGAASSEYKGMVDALVKVLRHEGIRGWYQGFIPGVFGISHGAVQFMIYEGLKNRYNQHYSQPIDTSLSGLEILGFAAISKLIAAGVTYPYQVVRSRQQDQHRSYKGVRDVISQLYRFEGIGGFYKGIIPNLLRVVPASCITFVVYEWIIATFKTWHGAS